MIVCSLFLLVLLLFFPSIAIAGSRYGASLWLGELLPTLLPFFIAVRLFQHCLPGAAGKRVFLLSGLLCGYPVGASLVAYQYDRHLLSREEAYFYLGFVNNPSPMFLLVFCGENILGMSPAESFLLFALCVLCSLAGSILFRLLWRGWRHPRENAPSGTGKQSARHGVTHGPGSSNRSGSESGISAATPPAASLSEVLDSIILDSFRVMVNVGGYVILFSILGQLLHVIFPEGSIPSLLGSGLLEISSGASYLKTAPVSPLCKKTLMMALLAFGGLSAAFQTSSILTRSELSLIPYLLNKTLNSILAAAAAFLLFHIL